MLDNLEMNHIDFFKLKNDKDRLKLLNKNSLEEYILLIVSLLKSGYKPTKTMWKKFLQVIIFTNCCITSKIYCYMPNNIKIMLFNDLKYYHRKDIMKKIIFFTNNKIPNIAWIYYNRPSYLN